MERYETIKQIVTDLNRLSKNTESFVCNALTYFILQHPPFKGSMMEFDMDQNKFLFWSHTKNNTMTQLNMDGYIKADYTQKTLKELEFMYYPHGKDSILLTPKTEWILKINQELKYSNESMGWKKAKIKDYSDMFYRWYIESIDKEMSHFQSLLSEDVTMIKEPTKKLF